MWERLGNRHAINAGRYFVALIAHEAGRHAEAIERADEVAASARQLDDTRRVSQALQVRGKALCALRRWGEAAVTLNESIRLAWDAMAPVELTRALRDLPGVLAHLRRAEAAVRLQACAAKAAEAHVRCMLSWSVIKSETSSRRTAMAQTHARSGQVVSVRPLGDRLSGSRTTAILKADQLEVVRIVLEAGKHLREHSAPGEITVLCIEGRIELRTADARHVLEAGDFIHLCRNEPHALEAIADSSALLTLCIAKAS